MIHGFCPYYRHCLLPKCRHQLPLKEHLPLIINTQCFRNTGPKLPLQLSVSLLGPLVSSFKSVYERLLVVQTQEKTPVACRKWLKHSAWRWDSQSHHGTGVTLCKIDVKWHRGTICHSLCKDLSFSHIREPCTEGCQRSVGVELVSGWHLCESVLFQDVLSLQLTRSQSASLSLYSSQYKTCSLATLMSEIIIMLYLEISMYNLNCVKFLHAFAYLFKRNSSHAIIQKSESPTRLPHFCLRWKELSQKVQALLVFECS